MVKFPEPVHDDLGQLVHKMYERTGKDWRRPHLGASIIGRECWRDIYYGFRWVTPPGFKGRMLRLFERGNIEEEWLVEDFKKVAAETDLLPDLKIWPVDPKTGKQFQVSYLGGHFGGSADGVIQGVLEAPKTAHLWECKTSNEKYFRQLEREGVKKAKPDHYAQMQIYMHGMKLTRAYYMVVNKNTDEIYCERIKFIPNFAHDLINKAEAIVFAEEPPTRVSEDPSYFKCKFCNHKKLCHDLEKVVPEVNCRTCAHSTAQPDGTWHCDVHDVGLNLDEQRVGCSKHVYIPYLLEDVFGTFFFSAPDGPDTLIVEYKNGVLNGLGGKASAKIWEDYSC